MKRVYGLTTAFPKILFCLSIMSLMWLRSTGYVHRTLKNFRVQLPLVKLYSSSDSSSASKKNDVQSMSVTEFGDILKNADTRSLYQIVSLIA